MEEGENVTCQLKYTDSKQPSSSELNHCLVTTIAQLELNARNSRMQYDAHQIKRSPQMESNEAVTMGGADSAR